MKQKVLTYDAIFEEQPEGGYTVTVPALPGCISQGETLQEAKAMIADAITVYLESLIMDGQKIPKGNATVILDKVSVEQPSITA